MRYKRGDMIRVNDHEFEVLDARDGEVFFQADGYRMCSLPQDLVEKADPKPRVGEVWMDRSGRVYLVARDDYGDLVGVFIEEHGYFYSMSLIDKRDFAQRIYPQEDP